MLIDKNYKGITRIENGDYVLDEIITDENLKIDLDDRLIIRKSIKVRSIESNVIIKAGSYIEAGGYIEVGKSIKAGSYIEAGKGIVAMLYIKAKKYISAGLRIFAGICNWRDINESDMAIECSELKSGEICYGKLKIIEEVKEIKEEAEKELAEKYNCKVKISINEEE